MRKSIRVLLPIAGIIVLCAWAVSPAHAHAVLLRSSPEANATLAGAPAQVELFFSEPLQAGLSSISVLNSNGQEVDARDVRIDAADPARMTVSLGSLSDGVYTVSWKAISAADGHFTTGSFPFAIGSAGNHTPVAGTPTSSATLPISALFSKWLLLASLALLVGQASFISIVWDPALRADGRELSAEVRRPAAWDALYRYSLMALLVALAIGLLSQAGQAAGNELAFPWARETNITLVSTRLGAIWLARLGLAVLAILLTYGRPSGWKHWTGFAVNLALLLTVTLTSHADAEAQPLLPVLDDWIHLIGMAFWFGGLAYLMTGLRALRGVDDKRRTSLTSRSITRFSVMAICSVALIGITGLYSASLRIGTLDALIDSLYGHAMLVKQVFVAGLLALAAVNLLVISPRLARDSRQGIADAPLVERFGKAVLAEVVLACLLLLSVSVLTYLPPARIAAAAAGLNDSAEVDDLKMDVSITPGQVGQNAFTLRLESNGQPLPAVKAALLRFTPGQGNLAPFEAQLIGQGDGTYTTQGSYFSLPGIWQVQAVVRRERKFDAYANFNFTVRNPGAADQSLPTPKLAGGLLAFDGLACLLLMLVLADRSAPVIGMGALVALTMIGFGIFYFTRPIGISAERVNPIPPNAESVAAGQVVFTVHCLPCHGPAGKGDGPLGLTLNPRPADLTPHAIPGVHTDAQLFEWITNGFPGSRMPAFKTLLPDTDRWNLVNFIRTLAPE